MDSTGVLSIIFFVVICVLIAIPLRRARVNAMSPDEVAQSRQREFDYHMLLEYGPVNSQLFCPHCQSKGYVRAKPVVQKVGISGGKATAAVLTLGASMLATGLSRKQSFTQAHCDNCNSTWLF